ncbi:MAG: gliding motility-associated C-terminal domain-containing protein [Bacteroidota bacterium]
MKKSAFTLLLFLLICQAYSQNFSGCVEIDFENIPGGPYQEGSIIDNQYLSEFGIQFSLEDGTSPRLAEVGGIATAFGSVWGNDSPAPGEDIGEFFLTDDGSLFGLNMIPVIVSFEEPIDSFSACVLDIDFGETFLIEAFDQNGNRIIADTIRDGDPDTGDGLATCWGFNFDGCEGSVYSVRFEGFRDTEGAFGLGLDNFSFCFSGTDIASNISIDTDTPGCNEETGAIRITNSSNQPLQYSIDGFNFQESPVFEDLPLGNYVVFIRDTMGCEATFINIAIDGLVPLVIDEIAGIATSCGEDNGSISILTTPSQGVQYALDPANFQQTNVFDSLPSGEYPIFILDNNNCLYTEVVQIDTSTAPVFNTITPIIDNCNDGGGQILVSGSGGTGELTYFLNEQISSTTGIFDSVRVGEYTILMTDEAGCTLSTTTTVEGGPLLLIDEVLTQNPTCESTSGAIQLSASGGTGQLVYRLDGNAPSLDGTYNGLIAGTYTLNVTDNAGCVTTTSAALEVPVCPIFVPNAFSPNGDGFNDEFILFTNPNYDVTVLRCDIFDRWGELVWRSENFTLHTFSEWWDGNFRSQPAIQGVYVYVAHIQYNNGQEEMLAGDVTLVR